MSMSIILQTSFCFGISTYINSMNSPTWGASMSDELVVWIHFYQNYLSLNFGIYFWSCSLAKDTLMCEVTPGFPLIVVGAQLMLVHRPNYFCTPHNFTFGPYFCVLNFHTVLLGQIKYHHNFCTNSIMIFTY